MAHKRLSGKKRDRPYNPNAKRHQTTRAGRRGDRDLGSQYLVAKKIRLTTRPDCELTPAAALYGLGHLDNSQYSRLGALTLMLRRIARSMGQRYTVAGICPRLSPLVRGRPRLCCR